MKALLFAIPTVLGGAAVAQNNVVVEVVTMNLGEGVSVAEFAAVDKAIEDDHVSEQPGLSLGRPPQVTASGL